MAFTAKPLGNGFVANASGAIFTASATATYIKRISLFNTNAATQTVIVYLNVSGTDREFARYTLAQYERADVIESGALLFESGDIVKAVTTTASAVQYYVDGVEET